MFKVAWSQDLEEAKNKLSFDNPKPCFFGLKFSKKKRNEDKSKREWKRRQ